MKAPTSGNPKANWELAARLFPRVPFPWEVLPQDIADSLQQLGRACATSSNPLPGAAFCMVGSILGRTVSVSPKPNWNTPLSVWQGDIRDSGENKTAPPRLMAKPIHEAQKADEDRFKKELATYKRLSKTELDKESAPTPARGYFVSDLTLEGLRDDLDNSPHGGIVVIQDELSSFINEQNQYKSKGTDREAWLKLFDGHPARIVRAGRSIYLTGARVSIFGGIQPKVFKTVFTGSNGLYLKDGTLFRFLLTCEPPAYFDLTAESWEDRHQEKWETPLYRAMEWVDAEIYSQGGRIENPTQMIFDSEAQEKFYDWRNQIFSIKDQLPAQLQGFLPKAVEYVLRLTGVIHCLHRFSIGKTPRTVLTIEDLGRGIKTVSFYLGQIQGALRLIEEDDYSPPEISERSLLLAQTLDLLRLHLHDGRLAVGFIHKYYNTSAPETQRIKTPRGMGAVLRAAKLNFAPGKHNANGYRSASCLEWDKATETFIQQCLQCLQRLKSQDWQGFEDADIENPMSALSASSTEPVESAQTLQTSENQCLHQETYASTGLEDITDFADIVEVEI